MKRAVYLILVMVVTLHVTAQEKKSLTIDDLVTWKRITELVISDDGSVIAFKTEPSQGDPEIKLYDGNGELKATFNYATGAAVSSDSKFFFFTIKAPYEEVRQL